MKTIGVIGTGCDASFGERALALFAETLERGWGAEDDAVLLRTALAKIAQRGSGGKSD